MELKKRHHVVRQEDGIGSVDLGHYHFKFKKRRLFILLSALALVLLLSVGMASAAGEVPGNIGYPIKRMGERIASVLTFGSEAKQAKADSYAERRVEEADIIDDRIADESPDKQIADAQVMQDLLAEYRATYTASITHLSQHINEGTKFSQDSLKEDKARDVHIYEMLMNLRLGAPPEVQATVLQSIATLQTRIATVEDALGVAPVSPADSAELTELLSQGFLSREELTSLLSGATSNRQLLDSLRSLVRSGKISGETIYAINYDLIKRVNPSGIDRFEAAVKFDELRKVAIFAAVVTPTPEQQKAMKAYLANYTYGKLIPRDDTHSYLMPLVYGLSLSSTLGDDLKVLNASELSPVRKALYAAWQPLTASDPSDIKALYSQALQLADASIGKNVPMLERIQLEVLKAVRSNVAYLALPAGWTDTQIATVQASFEQMIKDTATTNAVSTRTAELVTALSVPTAELSVPFTQSQVEQIRKTVEASVAELQKQLVNAAVSAGNTVPDQTAQIKTIQQQLDQLVGALRIPTGVTSEEVAILRADLQSALTGLADARTKIADFTSVNGVVTTSIQDSITALARAHEATETKLKGSIETVTKTGDATATQLLAALATVTKDATDNVTSIQSQLDAAKTTQAATQVQLLLSQIEHANQIAALKGQLDLSDAARAVLKSEVETTIVQVKTEQAAVIAELQQRIAATDALHTQTSSATGAQIAALQTAQAALLTALQAQVTDTTSLTTEVHASLSALTTAQSQTQAQVSAISAGSSTLTQQLTALTTTVSVAQQHITDNAAANQVARTELQQSIDTVNSAQTTLGTQLTDGLDALSTQLRQAVGEVQTAQAQTDLAVASLGTSVGSLTATLTGLQTLQTNLALNVQAQADANTGLRADLEASVGQLAQAQTATQAQVDGISADVTQIKTSVTVIAAAQSEAEAHIEQLLGQASDWTTTLANLQFSQSQFATFEAQLQTEFEAKAAALQAQFQAYKAELDGTIQQLSTDTNNQIQDLKDTQAALQAQIQQANAQIQALQAALATPTPIPTPTPGIGL